MTAAPAAGASTAAAGRPAGGASWRPAAAAAGLDLPRRLPELLLLAVSRVAQEQVPTGEMPSYRRTGARGALAYCRGPLVSTFVHEALGCFSPLSPWADPQALELLPARLRAALIREVQAIRRRIRSFLAWQEECDGTWRYYGRGSGTAADPDTTARAAAALLEAPGRALRSRFLRHAAAVSRFRDAGGTFPGPLPPLAAAAGAPCFDRAAHAHVLAFMSLAGGDVDELAAALWRAAAAGESPAPGERYPDPVCLAWSLARTARSSRLPALCRLETNLSAGILAREREDGRGGDFGGALATSFAVLALLDLGYHGPALARAGLYLLSAMHLPGGWGYEPLLRDGGGSPACTTALASAALARAAANTDLGSWG